LDVLYKDFWEAMNYLLETEVKKKKNKFNVTGIHEILIEDIKNEFLNKTYKELLQGQEEIKNLINKQETGTDIEYWEGILELLSIYKSYALIDEYNNKIIKLFKEKDIPIIKEKVNKTYNNKEIEIHDELLLKVLSFDDYLSDGKIKKKN